MNKWINVADTVTLVALNETDEDTKAVLAYFKEQYYEFVIYHRVWG